MKIRNVEFDFDILRASDADRMQAAVTALRAAEQAAPKAGQTDLGSVIRYNCGLIDSLLTEVLGEDYDQRLGIETDNLRQLKAVYLELLGSIDEARRELDLTAAAAPQQPAPAPVVTAVEARAKAAAAARAAAQSLPQPAPQDAAPAETTVPFPASPAAPAAPAPDFAHMNRAQRRAYIQALTGRK